LPANTTGASNTAVGSDSLAVSTTGSYNTAVGMQALQANTTASNNTAVGYQAGYSNTTGVSHTVFGYQAGYSNVSGNQNSFFGPFAGNATTGGLNTFIGGESGSLVTSGTKNTIIGRFNGNQNSLDIRTSSNNIVLSDGDGNPRGIFNSSGKLSLQNTTFNGPFIAANTSVSVANNGTIDITTGSAGAVLICVYETNTGNGGVFFGSFSTTITKIAGDGSATDSGSGIAVYKSSSSHTITFKNRYGSTANFNIAVYSASGA
jgi:hypothetical protein